MTSAPPRVGAVVVAGGAGRRFGAEDNVPKQFRLLDGRPVAVRAVDAVLAHPSVERVVLVLPEEGFDRWRDLVAPCLERVPSPRRVRFVPGGRTRQESSWRGLAALDEEFPGGDEGATDLALVHDAARPGAPPDLVERVVAAAAAHGAAVPVVRPADTLWRLAPEGTADGRLDRAAVVAAQTPQGFRRALLREALRSAEAAGFEGTDEASAVRRAGHPVHVVAGSSRNLKVTTPDDLALLEGLGRLTAPVAGPAAPPRIGHGFDAHRYGDQGVLALGGLVFPEMGALLGHSDGDAVLHALTDAVLGAVAGPDIGSLFPSSDPSLRGAASREFLARAIGIAEEAGFRPGQADLTVIAERPRLAPRRGEMRRSLAGLLGVPENAVGLKATTTDGLGFAGRGEGLAASAVVRLDPLPAAVDPERGPAASPVP